MGYDSIRVWLAENSEIGRRQEEMFYADMKTIQEGISSDLYKLIEGSWNKRKSSHPMCLTATWALRKILAR